MESYSRSPQLFLPRIVFPDGPEAPGCVPSPPSAAALLMDAGSGAAQLARGSKRHCGISVLMSSLPSCRSRERLNRPVVRDVVTGR